MDVIQPVIQSLRSTLTNEHLSYRPQRHHEGCTIRVAFQEHGSHCCPSQSKEGRLTSCCAQSLQTPKGVPGLSILYLEDTEPWAPGVCLPLPSLAEASGWSSLTAHRQLAFAQIRRKFEFPARVGSCFFAPRSVTNK